MARTVGLVTLGAGGSIVRPVGGVFVVRTTLEGVDGFRFWLFGLFPNPLPRESPLLLGVFAPNLCGEGAYAIELNYD